MEFLSLLTLQQWAAVFAIITAILTMFTRTRTLMKGVWLRLRDKIFPTRALLREHVEDEQKSIDLILAQLIPNGSTSLRDAVDRIEHKQNDIEAFLSAQLNVHSVAIVRTDEDGKLIYVNRAYQRIFGVSPQEVMGDGWVNIIHPSDRVRIKDLWEETVASRREFTEDILFQATNGETIPGHANVYRELDSMNRVRGWIGVIVVGDQMCFDKKCYDSLRTMLAERDYEDNSDR